MLLCATMVFLLDCITVSAQEKNDEVKIMATSNLSETPAEDGFNKIKEFIGGDCAYELTSNSSRAEKKAAVKMSFELYKAGRIRYDEYVHICNKLGLKPKRCIKRK